MTATDLKYASPAEVDYGDYSPTGECINGYVTRPVELDGVFGLALGNLIRKELGRSYIGGGQILMTTTDCWSGYSEYTITNQWSEITITMPAINFEKTWVSMGDFFRAVADANPEADRT